MEKITSPIKILYKIIGSTRRTALQNENFVHLHYSGLNLIPLKNRNDYPNISKSL